MSLFRSITWLFSSFHKTCPQFKTHWCLFIKSMLILQFFKSNRNRITNCYELYLSNKNPISAYHERENFCSKNPSWSEPISVCSFLLWQSCNFFRINFHSNRTENQLYESLRIANSRTKTQFYHTTNVKILVQ